MSAALCDTASLQSRPTLAHARTLSSHNPASYKARGIGDHAVNDAPLSLNGFF